MHDVLSLLRDLSSLHLPIAGLFLHSNKSAMGCGDTVAGGVGGTLICLQRGSRMAVVSPLRAVATCSV